MFRGFIYFSTQAANGKVRLVINAYFDAKPRRTEAFVKKVLKA